MTSVPFVVKKLRQKSWLWEVTSEIHVTQRETHEFTPGDPVTAFKYSVQLQRRISQDVVRDTISLPFCGSPSAAPA